MNVSRILRGRTSLALAVTLGGVAVGGALLLQGGSAGAAQGTPPPWAPAGVSQDANAVGGLEFFDSTGKQITSGSTNAAPFAAFTAGLVAPRAGDTKASLFAYLPQAGLTPDVWASQDLLGLATDYPDAAAPASLATQTLPVNAGGSTDTTLDQVTKDFPNTSTTTGYVNTYEIRMYTSSKGNGVSTKYDYADITIDATTHTWTQVFSPNDPLTPSPTDSTSPTGSTSSTGSPTGSTSSTGSPTGSTSSTGSPTGSTSSTGSPTGSTSSTGSPSSSGSTTPTTSASGSSSSSSSGSTSGNVTAIGPDGRELGANPTLVANESVNLTVTGFAPSESVDVSLHSQPTHLATLTADSTGTVTFPFTVPTATPAGSHVVAFDATSQDASFAFTVASPTSSTTQSSSGGGLADTGFDTRDWGGAGAMLLGLGGLLLMGGRRVRERHIARHAR